MNATSTMWDESVGALRRWKDALTGLCSRHGFYRSRHHRMIAGVCGGLAERFEVPVSLVRFVFVLIALPGFLHAALLYLALAFLMPETAELSPYSS
jgi:phage shock protein PspC (stress-responsive transcriptional regulator)